MVSIVCVLNELITVWGISHFLSKDDSSDRTLAIYIVLFWEERRYSEGMQTGGTGDKLKAQVKKSGGPVIEPQ